MKRRDVLAMLGGTAIGFTLAARAQKSGMPVIGFLNSASPAEWTPRVAAFRRGLGEAGYTEGQNVAIEFRWAEGRYERLPALAADLVRRQVAIIAATGGSNSVLAAKAATRTIPIVFTLGNDPVRLGVVASLNRPGGNVTGVSIITFDLTQKLVGLLHELVPKATAIALLEDPENLVAEPEIRAAQEAADKLGLQLQVLRAHTGHDIDVAFAALVQARAEALLVGSSSDFESHREQLIALSARHAVPTLALQREFPMAGGLASYGADFNDAYRQAGVYAGRILAGAKPADLPIIQPTKFELVINLKTAKALGLTIPQPLLLRADEVIQ